MRFMLELAQASGQDSPVSMSLVAQRTQLSRPYLDQLAMALRHAALIRARSGRKGGYVLARPADKILLLEIVEAAIGTVAITDCVDGPAKCVRSPLCACRGIWVRINDRIRAALAEYTLADLARESTALEQSAAALVPAIKLPARSRAAASLPRT